MSCKECEKVADMMHAVLDGEATCNEMKEFEMHLDNCINCSSHYHEEKELFKEIKAKMKHKCCPEQVLNSIMDKIQQFIK
jgi:anti-sigma factor (TIGR02949 family)